jgi:hypothetical protein
MTLIAELVGAIETFKGEKAQKERIQELVTRLNEDDNNDHYDIIFDKVFAAYQKLSAAKDNDVNRIFILQLIISFCAADIDHHIISAAFAGDNLTTKFLRANVAIYNNVRVAGPAILAETDMLLPLINYIDSRVTTHHRVIVYGMLIGDDKFVVDEFENDAANDILDLLLYAAIITDRQPMIKMVFNKCKSIVAAAATVPDNYDHIANTLSGTAAYCMLFAATLSKELPDIKDIISNTSIADCKMLLRQLLKQNKIEVARKFLKEIIAIAPHPIESEPPFDHKFICAIAEIAIEMRRNIVAQECWTLFAQKYPHLLNRFTADMIDHSRKFGNKNCDVYFNAKLMPQ